VPDIFEISVTALRAFQTALSVTSNNIANANTPGYARERIDLTAAPPQADGAASVGSGVVVTAISRAYSQATVDQLNSSQGALGQLNSLQNYTNQIDNLFGTTVGGVSTALQGFYNAWSDVANNPTSTASRQALLGKAQSLSASFQNTSAQLNALNADVNARIGADVTQINTIATSIAKLNQQIVVAKGQDGGFPPNELLDQRDTLVSNLSQLVGVTTSTDSNGALNVFVGNGQPLVLQAVTTALTTVPNSFNSAQLEVSSAALNGNVISGSLNSGDLGGLLAARGHAIDPAINQLGQIATALSGAVNAQQNAGLNLNGQLGGNLYSIAAPAAVASSKNTGTAAATVNVIDTGALTSSDYLLSFKAGAYALTRVGDGANVPLTGSGSAANPFVAVGLSIVLTGASANGDQILIRPTAGAAATFKTVLVDPSQLAAAGAVQSTTAGTNTGSATIGVASVLDATNPNLLVPTSIQFTSPTTYSINGAGSFAYAAGSNISLNGWQVQISGVPATGDSFSVKTNAGSAGDNRNALLFSNQRSLGVLAGGTVSIGGAVGALLTGAGSLAQQVNTAQTAQAAINSQAQQNFQSVSGVNLDEEAASLLQWQNAYQASAKALQIGSTLFQTLLTAVHG
jgi:flagellar hook-associated protein 1 FlgK